MFDYPLKKREIFLFLGQADERHEFDAALLALVQQSFVYKIGEFYSLRNHSILADRRMSGNDKAAKMLLTAGKVAGIIAKFPFVRGVAVSGSLSKNFANETADIDFFIITSANRLWLCRTLLHLFKKLTFLVRKEHFFCMNYFVDETGLTILEKNIYTATEIATLMPMHGNAIFEKFYSANTWTKKFLPNNYMRVSSAKDRRMGWLAYVIERMLDNQFGNVLDNLFVNLTVRSWGAKTQRKKLNSRGIVMSMDSGKHYSKPNPANFQQKLLQHYHSDLAYLFERFDPASRLTNELL